MSDRDDGDAGAPDNAAASIPWDEDLRQVPSAAAMEALGQRLARHLRAGDLVVLRGPLGAGKTTLTRGIGAGLGVRGPIQSPTFVLARMHPSLADGPPLIHADLYRLGGVAELWDLDLDFDHAVTVAEWGAGLIESAATSHLAIAIARPDIAASRPGGAPDPALLDADEPRTIRVLGYGPRWTHGVNTP